jgi:hypothetical protein
MVAGVIASVDQLQHSDFIVVMPGQTCRTAA